MPIHWHFCGWPLPFCWASSSKSLRVAEAIIVGQEYCIASVCMCTLIIFSVRGYPFIFLRGGWNLSMSSPHFPASISVQEYAKVESDISEL